MVQVRFAAGIAAPALSTALPEKESSWPTLHVVAADGVAIVTTGTPAETVRVVVPVAPLTSVTVSSTVYRPGCW